MELLNGIKAVVLPILLLVAHVSSTAIARRAIDLTCSDLRVDSNNGDRKIAIVIDSSGSMSGSDPFDLRLEAGRALNDFLINNKEASGGKKADQIAVIDFDDTATLKYSLGDPGAAANSSFGTIDASGGTYIASGVRLAIQEITKSGSGTTAGRSGIVVFTDGEDPYTTELVEAINQAAGLGIRVSFGFLDATAGYQDKDIVFAIGKSGGVYSTITSEDSSNSFINYAILNGLTTNDNPQGNNSTLLAGLATAHFTAGSQTQSVTYSARAHEHIDFMVQSIDAGPLTAELLFGGSVRNNTNSTSVYDYGYLSYTAPSAGKIEIKVTAKNAPEDSLFIVSATSNMPTQNCTVGVGPNNSGLNKGAKIGIGVGVPIAVGLLGLGGYFLWKFLHPASPPFSHAAPPSHPPGPAMQQPGPYAGVPPTVPPPKPDLLDPHQSVHSISDVSDLSDIPPAVPPAVPPAQPPQDSKKHRMRIRRKGLGEKYHHHHLDPYHPCHVPTCQLINPEHICTESRCLCADPDLPMPNHNCADIKTPCACTDQKCPLNDPDHECRDPNNPCKCEDEHCPLSEEQRKRRLTDTGLGIGTKVANAVGNHLLRGP